MLPYVSYYTVYHGTNLFSAKVILNNGILLHVQRNHTDFGHGFYVTPNLTQAKQWAYTKIQNKQVPSTLLSFAGMSKTEYLNHPDTSTPAYLTMNINLNWLFFLKGIIFPMPFESQWNRYKDIWISFVQHCRKGRSHDYDFVYGPVGKNHNGTYNQFIPSHHKKQLSLNSPYALQCLSNIRMTTLKPATQTLNLLNNNEQKNDRVFSNKRHMVVHPFLIRIRDELIQLGQYSYQEANDLVKHSWVAEQIDKKNEMILEEDPKFWAFFLLYGTTDLWFEEYETYMKRNKK